MRNVRIAFFGYENFAWTGGLNYLKNLLQSISLQKDRKVEPFLFVSRYADPKALEIFKPFAKVITTPSFDPIEIFLKLLDKTIGSKFHINYLLKKYNIDIVSHSYKEGIKGNIKKISWIPDFQHLHLPHLFSQKENNARNKSFKNKIEWADIVVLSSKDALKDFKTFAPEQLYKARVLQFVSNIDQENYQFNEEDFNKIRNKYRLPAKFFYLPNQFWKHKNHKTVIEAVILLKNQGLDLTVVCTGNMQTEEVVENVNELQAMISQNDLQNNILLLGLVNYEEVQIFLRFSVSVINPSLFEGWSSTVEECKSLGKNMIVSEIDVHKEQDPPKAFFFNPDNAVTLSELLKENWGKLTGGPDYELEKHAKKSLDLRIENFGRNYVKIINELI